MNNLFKGFEIISNHGTSSEIIGRFLFQPKEIAKRAYNNEDVEKKFRDFEKMNIPDFHDLHDLFNEIKSKYIDFITGLKNGKYFSIDEHKSFTLDRSVEIELHRKIKDFYILGRLLLNNFSKSKIIDTDYFILNDFLLVNDNNFNKNKEIYYKNDTSKKFESIILNIEQSRKNFLNTFNQIRADFEHQNLQIPKVHINTENGEINEIGLTKNLNLLEEIELIYKNLMDLIEILMVFHFGIIAVKKNQNFGIYESKHYDYSLFSYRFLIFPIGLGTEEYELVI